MTATWERRFGMWRIEQIYFDRKIDCIRHAKQFGLTVKFVK